MKDKRDFERIAEKHDIDEIWVNFKNPFDADHESDEDKCVVVYSYGKMQDQVLIDGAYNIKTFFSSSLNDQEEKLCITSNMQCQYVTLNDESCKDYYNEYKKDCTLLYKKGIGIINKKNKEDLVKIAEKHDIDEIWVNFKNPFDVDHERHPDKFLLVYTHGKIGDKEFISGISDVEAFFAPSWNSDDERIFASVDLFPMYVTLCDEDDRKYNYNHYKKGHTLLYKKGVGIIG